MTQGVADFLQEVTSRKDQAQYWHSDKPYSFVSVSEFAEAFRRTKTAEDTRQLVNMPYDRAASPKGALVRRAPAVLLQFGHESYSASSSCSLVMWHAAFLYKL